MKATTSSLLSLLLIGTILPVPVLTCTNVLVTPGASADGNPMIAYNADSGSLMGTLYHYPASTTGDGSGGGTIMRKVFNWDTGAYLGEIPEAKETYNVVGNTNEHGLVIAETTFGGLEILDPKYQPGAKIDYGSLIWITLQRTKTAREAIQTMADLVDEHGYASEGESFSIADRSGEVWIMELIGRGGTERKGAVWVAMRIPDGYVSGHSNQARITTFPRNDPDRCLYSQDVVELAKRIGVYKSSEDDPNDLNFSFSDVYDPMSFLGARMSEARTWAVFSSIAQDQSFQQKYENYAKGTDLTNRMPLWIAPNAKLNLEDIMNIMSNHYENTAITFDSDVGAGQYQAPYRSRPLVWSHNDRTYHNERAVGTQQTAWNFIAQIRLNVPVQISSILWFAVDDSSTSPRYPVYGSSTSVSHAYAGKGPQDGVPCPLLNFDLTKAFWVQNMVSNLVYSRYEDAYPILQEKIMDVHRDFQRQVHLLDDQIMALLQDDDTSTTQDTDEKEEQMVHLATRFSVKAGDKLHGEWLSFYGQLFARLRDFYVVTPDPSDAGCQCKVSEGGFSNRWKEQIVKDTGKHYEQIDETTVPDMNKKNLRSSAETEEYSGDAFLSKSKLQLKAMH